jgi:hypothetical protein
MGAMLPPSLWPLVHRMAGGRAWPPGDASEAESFVAVATEEGLLPLLFEAPDLPAVVRDVLAGRRLWARIFEKRAQTLGVTVGRLPGLLSGEPFILLKGCDYAHRLYPRPALRPMQDVDILVPRARFGPLCEHLRRMGIAQQFPGSPTHHVPWFSEAVFDLGDVTLEVHDSFLPRARHSVDYAALWDRRERLEVEGDVSRLSDVDAVAYHALSLAKDEFFARLIRYVDFWLMLRRQPGILPATLARAREWRALHALHGMLQQAQRCFPELAPELAGVLVLGASRRRFLDRWVLPGDRSLTRPRRRLLQLWRKFWLMDTASHRVRFGLSYVPASVLGRWRQWRAGRKLGKRLDLAVGDGDNIAHS